MAIVAASTTAPAPLASPLRITLHRSWIVVSFAAAMLSSAHAAAAPDNTPTPAVQPVSISADVKKKAAEHFETGLKLYEDGDFSLALIEFERAYSYVPDYRVLFNIGQVSVQLARYARAVHALRQYLQVGGKSVAPARVASVQEDLKMLEGRTAHLQIDCNVEGAEVLLDDVRIGHTPIPEPLLVDAGEHRLTLQKSGYVTRTERLVLAGRDESNQKLDLVEIPKAVAQPIHPTTAVQPRAKADTPETDKPMSTRTQLLYAGVGATALFTVGWAVTGYVGIKAAGDLRDALQRPTSQGELDTYQTKARGALIASDILGAAALITGGTTLYFTLKGPGKEQPKAAGARVHVHFAPSAVLVTGAF